MRVLAVPELIRAVSGDTHDPWRVNHYSLDDFSGDVADFVHVTYLTEFNSLDLKTSRLQGDAVVCLHIVVVIIRNRVIRVRVIPVPSTGVERTEIGCRPSWSPAR